MLFLTIPSIFFILLATAGMFANQSPMLGENFLRWNVLILFVILSIYFYNHFRIIGEIACFVCFLISLLSAYSIYNDGIDPDKW